MNLNFDKQKIIKELIARELKELDLKMLSFTMILITVILFGTTGNLISLIPIITIIIPYNLKVKEIEFDANLMSKGLIVITLKKGMLFLKLCLFNLLSLKLLELTFFEEYAIDFKAVSFVIGVIVAQFMIFRIMSGIIMMFLDIVNKKLYLSKRNLKSILSLSSKLKKVIVENSEKKDEEFYKKLIFQHILLDKLLKDYEL